MTYSSMANPRQRDVGRSEEGLPGKVSLLLALTFFASSLLIPFILTNASLPSSIAAWASCVLTVAVIFISAKRPSRAFWTSFLIGFLGYFVGSPVFPALIFGSITSIASLSALICSANKASRIMAAVTVPLTYIVALCVTLDPIVSLFALFLAVPALISAVTTLKKVALTPSLTAVGFGILILAVLLLIYRMFILYGEISINSLTLATDSFVKAFVYYAEQAMTQVYEIEITETIRREITATAESCINLAPGIVSAAALIVAYLSNSTRKKIFFSYGINIYLTSDMTQITVSVPAALTFIIAYVLSFATSAAGGISLTAVIGNNLCLMLMPCLLIKGLEALKALPMRLGLWGLLMAAGLVIFLISVASSLPMLLALIGAFFVLIVSIDLWAKSFYGKGER